MTEDDIIKRLKAGDSGAYKKLYDLHYKTLCTYASKITQNSANAEMIVNDVIFSLWKNRSGLDIHNLRHYLLRAVRNRCINYTMQEKRNRNFQMELPEEDHVFQKQYEIFNTPNPIEKLLLKELDIKIQKSLDSMPDQTRTIFKLSRFSDLKYHEIADTLNISIDVVKYHIKQALLKLRLDLKDYFFEKR
ncbi:RNA polymerase sigma-70 factor [Sphingobacterium olei]|uniref:RNA polymerase sigma-70 factor n=1 Tax=Sphingobacterium olei TaxID=2571155 RepID=A0A4U0P0K1_9SPHI|nr:RNA polymerase sigma-70 factor [Sphingobacterium olei]TJZ60643.1 RNA polymerase sigma-70 factor [Sphingobacterium olei]